MSKQDSLLLTNKMEKEVKGEKMEKTVSGNMERGNYHSRALLWQRAGEMFLGC